MISTHNLCSFPQAMPTLEDHEVHVWRACLDRGKSAVQRLWPSLSADERERSQRFHFRKDRERYIVRRGLLRKILGRYLDMEPHNLRFSYGPYGKPHLTNCGGTALRFNLSHSNGLALFAISRHRRIGVDVEYIRRDVEYVQLAERYFAPSEVAALRALPEPKADQAFVAFWTRKEAYIKAQGGGMSIPLDQFEVSLQQRAPVRLTSGEGETNKECSWSLQELYPGPGYAAAVCVEGHGWELTARILF